MIHLISGKGGVGKSMVAASLAWRLASEGKKTLLVELGERSYFRHVFHTDLQSHSSEISTHLTVTRWEGEACLREYLRHLIKIERMVNLFFDNRVMRALVQAAPALRELALLGKITSGPRRIGPPLNYDEIVVDAFSTGHFRALWRAPVGLAQAIPFGPMGEQSRSIVRTLQDPKLTRFYVTMLPEEMPVTEGLELARDIQAEMDQSPVFILNRWLNSPLNREQLDRFKGHAFAEYVSTVLERQATQKKLLESRGVQPVILPWQLAGNLAENIRQLSAQMVSL